MSFSSFAVTQRMLTMIHGEWWSAVRVLHCATSGWIFDPVGDPERRVGLGMYALQKQTMTTPAEKA
jgi:hypothetical protein